jgi:glycosidase
VNVSRNRTGAAGLLAALALGCAAPRLASAPAPASDARASWHRSAVVYGVVPPLFGPGVPLREVTARLDALDDLGVDALWLAPVMATDDPGAISYAITDFLAVRPDYGSEADLRVLVREAHARGLKVLLDVVPNHTSTGHPWYRDAEARGPSSPRWGFYVRDAAGEAAWDFDWKHLRKLDYANPAVRREMTEAFVRWVRDLDVDGFRVDAAWGIRDRSPDFWPELVRAVRAVKPGALLVAEASARDGYYVRAGFDAAYDWTGELGRAAWEKVFDDLARVGPALDAALADRATPMDRVFRFLENNDTGERFVTRHGVATTRLATVLLHALPGVPALFTGQEVGAEYSPYDDPPPVAWVDRHGLRGLHRRLAALREDLPALRDGAYRRVEVPGNDAIFAFVRDAGAGPGARALVVLNFGPAARVRLAVPGGLGPGVLRDVLADRDVRAAPAGAGAIEVEVAAGAGLLLVPRAGVGAGAGPWSRVAGLARRALTDGRRRAPEI